MSPAERDFRYTDLLPLGADDTVYRHVTSDGVTPVSLGGRRFLQVESTALTHLTRVAMHDIAHFLRSGHLAQLAGILDDPEASANDRFVALDLLRNAAVASGGVLPMCQDTGTAIVKAERGQNVLTAGDDKEAISRGVYEAYRHGNLRYSQLSPLDMWSETNTGTNLPAEVKIGAANGDAYTFLFMAKGGGSANKSFLFQETKALLKPANLAAFLAEKLRALGTAACPPYHLAVVIGGTSAEFALETAKLASTRYLDTLPTAGNAFGHGFRDLDYEAEVLTLTRKLDLGAQFGGKYFCHDVRVVRLPRHGGSCPVAIAVSCSADRQAKAKITAEGLFLEQLETNPARFLPEVQEAELPSEVVPIDLGRPMASILAELSRYPVKTRLALTGTMVVARDLAHARFQELLDSNAALPAYLREYPIYYAGPAKTPEGYASGSFGPTTAGRMDSYVEALQAAGASMLMVAKGNRGPQVTESCKRHGGFYLGSIGGSAARLAQDCIRHVELLDYENLGMEAVWKIQVENFPAFIVVDDKGNDFFSMPTEPPRSLPLLS